MLKKRILCECGSGKPKDFCCAPKTRVFFQPFQNPEEHKEMLAKLKISSEFNMRYRGLVEFYGQDLIAYKLEKPKSEPRNEFLRALASYLTEFLEDDCPASWKECSPTFWEEFLLLHYPSTMKLSPDEKHVENFLYEFKKFVRWLDRRTRSSWSTVVQTYIENYYVDLKKCEHLLNSLFLRDFPRIHHNDWNHEQDLKKLKSRYSKYLESEASVFQITNIFNQLIEITDTDSDKTYLVKDIPQEKNLVGLLINGRIGKLSSDMVWSLYLTDCIFPGKAKQYLENCIISV